MVVVVVVREREREEREWRGGSLPDIIHSVSFSYHCIQCHMDESKKRSTGVL